jgi:hypothetical protein
MTGHVARMKQKYKHCFGGKPKEKNAFGRRRPRSENKIKIDLKERGREDINWLIWRRIEKRDEVS